MLLSYSILWASPSQTNCTICNEVHAFPLIIFLSFLHFVDHTFPSKCHAPSFCPFSSPMPSVVKTLQSRNYSSGSLQETPVKIQKYKTKRERNRHKQKNSKYSLHVTKYFILLTITYVPMQSGSKEVKCQKTTRFIK